MKKTVILAFAAALALPVLASAEAPAPDPRAKRAYRAKCASCHGEDGKGNTEQAKTKFPGLRDISSPEVQKEFTDDQLKEWINKGLIKKKDGKERKMPAVPEITGEQLDNLVRLVRGLAAK